MQSYKIFFYIWAFRLPVGRRRAFRFTSLGGFHARKGGNAASSSRRVPPTAVGNRLRFVLASIPNARIIASCVFSAAAACRQHSTFIPVPRRWKSNHFLWNHKDYYEKFCTFAKSFI